MQHACNTEGGGAEDVIAMYEPYPKSGLGGDDLSMMALQICDTSFPSGSLANSQGLEAALAHGLVDKSGACDDEEASAARVLLFLRLTLEQAARGSLPFLQAAHWACSGVESAGAARDGTSGRLHPEQLACLCDLDAICGAMMTNEVARRASLNSGKCFLRAASVAFADRPRAPLLPQISLLLRDGGAYEDAASAGQSCLHGHYAPIFGAVCAMLGLCCGWTERLFLRCLLRDLASCAARLSVLGPLEGAHVQARLGTGCVEELLRAARQSHALRSAAPADKNKEGKGEGEGEKDWAGLRKRVVERLLEGEGAPRQTAPMLDLVQGRHDVLYARLFNS